MIARERFGQIVSNHNVLDEFGCQQKSARCGSGRANENIPRASNRFLPRWLPRNQLRTYVIIAPDDLPKMDWDGSDEEDEELNMRVHL